MPPLSQAGAPTVPPPPTPPEPPQPTGPGYTPEPSAPGGLVTPISGTPLLPNQPGYGRPDISGIIAGIRAAKAACGPSSRSSPGPQA